MAVTLLQKIQINAVIWNSEKIITVSTNILSSTTVSTHFKILMFYCIFWKRMLRTLKYLTEPKLLMGRIKNCYKMYTYFYIQNMIYIINWNYFLIRHWHHGFFEENVDLMDLHWDIYCTFYSVWHLRPACQSRSSWPQWWVWDLEADDNSS